MNAISASFAEVLRQCRDDFNQRFTHAKRACAELDGPAFLSFVQRAIDPLVVAVATVQPEAALDMASAAYDIALELACQGLLSPRYALIEDSWRDRFTTAPMVMAAAPNRVLGSLTNALHHLLMTPGARAEQWSIWIAQLAPRCTDVDTLLRLGQVLAWRAGLAHFRESALTVADALPADLAVQAVGGSGDVSWTQLRERLQANPWCDPAQSEVSSQLRFAAEVGSFRGFGGLFPEPPRVAAREGQLLVRSRDQVWAVYADHFGATFHRATVEDFEAAPRARPPKGIQLERDRVSHGRAYVPIESYGALTSDASTEHTLALTADCTHAVILLSLP